MTPDQRLDVMIAKAMLLQRLLLLVRCIVFYGWSRILGFIPAPQ